MRFPPSLPLTFPTPKRDQRPHQGAKLLTQLPKSLLLDNRLAQGAFRLAMFSAQKLMGDCPQALSPPPKMSRIALPTLGEIKRQI